MSGQLGLSTPWVRQVISGPLRDELKAAVPDGWSIGISASPNRNKYKAWANDDRSGAFALHIVEYHDAEQAIRAVIRWIHENETWTEAPPAWEILDEG